LDGSRVSLWGLGFNPNVRRPKWMRVLALE
jgi:hypothetical protein